MDFILRTVSTMPSVSDGVFSYSKTCITLCAMEQFRLWKSVLAFFASSSLTCVFLSVPQLKNITPGYSSAKPPVETPKSLSGLISTTSLLQKCFLWCPCIRAG